jgi:hypothetical protein
MWYYSKGTALQMFRGDRHSVKNFNNQSIKYSDFQNLFFIKSK